MWLRADHPDTPLRLAWERLCLIVHDDWRANDREQVILKLARVLAVDEDRAASLLDVVGYPALTSAQKAEARAKLQAALEPEVDR